MKDRTMEEQLIGSIEKNATEAICVRLVEFHDRPFIDIRVFATTDATGKVPTRKGVAVRPDLIPELRALLEEAEAAAREAGLLGDDTTGQAP